MYTHDSVAMEMIVSDYTTPDIFTYQTIHLLFLWYNLKWEQADKLGELPTFLQLPRVINDYEILHNAWQSKINVVCLCHHGTTYVTTM